MTHKAEINQSQIEALVAKDLEREQEIISLKKDIKEKDTKIKVSQYKIEELESIVEED